VVETNPGEHTARRRGGAKLPGRERRENFDGGNTCGIAEERGPRAGERGCWWWSRTATGRRAKTTVRVEDAGDGKGLPPPSPATGPHASGRARPSPRATRTTSSCST
jgi:hypothetical protein